MRSGGVGGLGNLSAAANSAVCIRYKGDAEIIAGGNSGGSSL